MRKKLFKTLGSAVMAMMLFVTSSIPSFAAATNYPLTDGYALTTTLRGRQAEGEMTASEQHAFQNFDIRKCYIPDGYAECGIPYYEFEGKKYRFYDYTYAIPWVARQNRNGRTANVQFMISWEDVVNDGNGDLTQRRLLIDDVARAKTSANYYAPATSGEGRQILRAFYSWFMDSLAAQGAHVDNIILGNEVNAHNAWHYSGNIGTQGTVERYASAFYDMRQIVRKYSDKTRVSVCFDHTWNYYTNDVIGAKEYLRIFNNTLTTLNGGAVVDDWCVALHIYPCVLYQPAIWQDTPGYPTNMNELSENTRWVDGKNLSYVTNHIKNTYGENHRVMLTEQGFTSVRGDAIQAAALAYSYYAAKYDPMVDCFILYTSNESHVDSRLNFSINGNTAQYIYENIDDPAHEANIASIVLPTIGVSSWSQIVPNYGQTIQRKAYQGSGFAGIPVTGISLNATSLNLLLGTGSTLTATIAPENAHNKTVTWTSSNPAVATVNNGTITTLSAGTTVITAQSSNGLQAQCVVTVKSNPIGIALNATALKILLGKSLTVQATLTPADAFDKTVTWTSSTPAVATVNNGTITAVSVGTATITAQTVNGLQASCTVRVAIEPIGITLDTEEANMVKGDTLTVNATLTPSNVTETALTWTSSNPSVATVNNGVITARGAGSTVITAKTVNGLQAQCTIYSILEDNPENPFGDLSTTGNWEYPYAKYVYDNGYMGGKGDIIPGKVKFDPHTALTRAEFVQILYSIENKPDVTYTDRFTDVPEDAWYTDAVLWAAEQGIVAGNADGTFGTFGKATREQLALMFYQYANYKNYNQADDSDTPADLTVFEDADSIHTWARVGMEWAVSNQIMSGKGTLMDPLGQARRSECATMLKAFMENLAADNDTEEPGTEEPDVTE